MEVLSGPSSETRAQLRRMLMLAIPVIFAELGWMSMSVVDTIMVGPLGPAAIGAAGVGSSAFYTFAIFGMGLLLGLDTLVAQAFGAGDRAACHRLLTQGVYLALFITPVLMGIFVMMPPFFYTFGVNPQVSALAGPFVLVLSWGTLPLLLYGAQRRYLQAMGHVRPVMFVLVSANVVNWFFNWILIEGHWGLPALGVRGSALSTCIARVYMAVLLAVFIWWFERREPDLSSLFRKPDFPRIMRLLRIGFPAALQILLEIGAFGSAAVLAGRLAPVSLAAHQIALNCAAITFMAPLGISSAAAIAVGQSIGRGEPRIARSSGYIGLGLACVFMTCSALAFLSAPMKILRVYTSDPGVLGIGTGLLGLAGIFQLFDGIQTVATGALRGLGDTRAPMLVNLAGYWFFGLPLGYVLCFHYGYGVYGLWCGLTAALIAIASILLFFWNRTSRAIACTSKLSGY